MSIFLFNHPKHQLGTLMNKNTTDQKNFNRYASKWIIIRMLIYLTWWVVPDSLSKSNRKGKNPGKILYTHPQTWTADNQNLEKYHLLGVKASEHTFIRV